MASRCPTKAPDKSATFHAPNTGMMRDSYELRYYDAKHQYFVRGGHWDQFTWLPSTSAIAKLTDPPGDRLVAWAIRSTADAVEEKLSSGALTKERVANAIAEARKASDRKKESAGDYGTEAHALFERAISTKVWRGRVAPELRAALEAMRRWRDEWAVEVLEQEFLVLHPELGYAGTGDLRATFVLARALSVAGVQLPLDPAEPELRRTLYADLKTGKGTYRSNYAQMSGYELADRAVGGPGWDLAVLLHLPQGAEQIEVLPQKAPKDDARAFECARFLHWWAKEQPREGA